MYEVREINSTGKGPVLFLALAAADAVEALARRIGKPHCFVEYDPGYPDCVDIMAGDGRLFVIEPEGFEINKLPVET